MWISVFVGATVGSVYQMMIPELGFWVGIFVYVICHAYIDSKPWIPTPYSGGYTNQPGSNPLIYPFGGGDPGAVCGGDGGSS